MVAAPIPVAIPDPPPRVLREEVVALPGTGAGLTERAWARTLPWASDDLTRDFPDVYSAMVRDPQVSATTMVLLMAALNVTPTVQPGGARKRTPAYATARAYADHAQRELDNLPTPINQTLYEMGRHAYHYGHKAVELVWRDVTDPVLGPQLGLARIKGKPMQAYQLVQDAYGNMIGAVPTTTATGTRLVYTGPLQLSADGKVNGQPLIPLSKLPILSHDPQNGDLRGQSALRPVYNAWYMTQQILPELLALIARFGQPTVLGTNAPNQQDTRKTDAAGNALTSENPNATLAAALEQWRAGGVLALSAGQAAQLIEAQTEGQVFFSALTLFSGWITRGILGQTLATNEGAHRSGTDASTHQDIFAVVVRFCKAWLADWLRQAVVAPLIEYNYGPAALRYLPLVSLGQTDPHDFGMVGQVLAQLSNSNYWGVTGPGPQLGEQLDAMLGLPSRAIETDGPDAVPGTADDPAPPPTPVPPGGAPNA